MMNCSWGREGDGEKGEERVGAEKGQEEKTRVNIEIEQCLRLAHIVTLPTAPYAFRQTLLSVHQVVFFLNLQYILPHFLP